MSVMKPNQILFAVNSSGRLFGLKLDEPVWRELPYLGIQFKRVSAAKNVLWAIGGDHQIYVRIFGAEVPIRVREETYENQRWNPIDGFSNRLLPTDRPNFSNMDGTVERTKESIHLPTMAWQWETLWYFDTQFNGTNVDEGWSYAVDFPAEYHAKKGFSSCVRRRRWIRYRKYVALDSWSVIPSIHKDPSEEPFIDVSVGGHELPNGDPDELLVWVVTVFGKIYVRQGVRTSCPEGTGWLHIPTPERSEVSQISVGPTGMTWAVTWHGKVLVRLGVSRLDPTGTSWAVIDEPRPESPLTQVSVGENVVWAISRDRKVWFRNGIHGAGAGESESLARGTKWIEMVGQLQMINIGAGDQVFAIGCNEDEDETSSDFYSSERFCVVLRFGVNASDLSGKTWKKISLPIIEDFSDDSAVRTQPTAEPSSRNDQDSTSRGSSQQGTPSQQGSFMQHGSSNANFRKFGDNVAKGVVVTTVAGVAGATVGRIPIVGGPLTMAARQLVADELKDVRLIPGEEGDMKNDVQKTHHEQAAAPIDESMYVSAITGDESTLGGATAKLRLESESNDGASEGDRASLMSGLGGGLDREDRYDGLDDLAQSAPHWLWLAAGAIKIDPVQPPIPWFVSPDVSGSQNSLSGEPWRIKILQNLKERNLELNSDTYSDYEPAVERTSWVRKGTAKVLFGRGSSAGKAYLGWENCNVELEQTGTNQNEVDFGTLSIFGTSKKVKEHLSLSEITGVIHYAEKTLAIFTSLRSLHLQPLQLKFTGDLDMEAWQAHLVKGLNCVRLTQSTPSPTSLLSVTSRGEVCVFDPVAAEKAGSAGDVQRTQDDVKYSQEINIHSMPFLYPLQNGFCPGSQLFFIVKLHDSAERFSINLQVGRMSAESDIALHFNPRLDQNKVVLNDRRSGNWGLEEYLPIIMMQEDCAMKAFNQGHSVQVLIKCEAVFFQIFVNGSPLGRFNHRFKPEEITHFRIQGDIEAQSATYRSVSVILPPPDMYWRVLGGGHLLQVESCSLGITWGLGYDFTSYIYTGGWGGSHFKGIDTSKTGIQPMEDTKYFYVYENQRWNPITGFNAHGLPTDRYSWSDRSGRQSMTKESVKPPSIHWQWASDWMVDYHTPGGVDKDGWQYATDFPASYHRKMGITDYVRRRRWSRKCKLATSGPWRPHCSTKLIDVTMMTHPSEEKVYVWAISSSGDALFRQGVNPRCPEGLDWTPVPSDTLFQSISIGGGGTEVINNFKVWAVAKDGNVFLRHGISDVAPTGQVWLQVHAPSSQAPIRMVSAGDAAVLWALDSNNRLYFRREITSVFPEGTAWTHVPVTSSNGSFTGGEVRSISVSGKEVWAVLDNVTIIPENAFFLGACSGSAVTAAVSIVGNSAASSIAQLAVGSGPANGVLARMVGISSSNPTGSGWEIAIGGGWKHVCIRGRKRGFF